MLRHFRGRIKEPTFLCIVCVILPTEPTAQRFGGWKSQSSMLPWRAGKEAGGLKSVTLRIILLLNQNFDRTSQVKVHV